MVKSESIEDNIIGVLFGPWEPNTAAYKSSLINIYLISKPVFVPSVKTRTTTEKHVGWYL